MQTIVKQEEIEFFFLYDKKGKVIFSTLRSEIGLHVGNVSTNIMLIEN